ncbi:hypothetical protein C8R44DRAFT_627933 [Mycena epipterygia]|nr:hypothetical protein C8R44DRAFT_627933 [Mycena epipterygia]
MHSEIWMPYGDIILQAESTLFKVNRDILAKHSPVFQGMFLVPQPQIQENIDGCPIVELSDTAKDVGLLLAALYDPFHYKFAQPVEVVAAMLRLGRKYEISSFKDDAISRMHREFPTQLQVWDRRIAKKTLKKIKPVAGVYVDLAFESGLHTCIPTLGFKCLRSCKFYENLNRNNQLNWTAFRYIYEVLLSHWKVLWLLGKALYTAAAFQGLECNPKIGRLAELIWPCDPWKRLWLL